jgi:glycosyltransferase involved in cell wall biosynthesis
MGSVAETMISVIVPVYNTPRFYLEACIESILQQTYTSFELFLVDDGSARETAEICDHYAEKDSRITVIHQENQGVSAARNAALSRIHGEFLTFVDSDDLLAPNAWEIAISSMDTYAVDCVVFGWRDFGEDNHWDHIITDVPQVISADFFQTEIAADNYRCGGGYPWNKVWRTRPLYHTDRGTSSLLPFEPSINMYEDKLWILQVSQHISQVLLLPDILYQYRYLSSSLTQDESQKISRLFLAYHAYDLILDCLEPKNNAAYIAAYNFYFSFCLHDLRFLKEDKEKFKAKYKGQYRQTRRVFHKLCQRIRPRTLHVPIYSKEFLIWALLHFLPCR